MPAPGCDFGLIWGIFGLDVGQIWGRGGVDLGSNLVLIPDEGNHAENPDIMKKTLTLH